MCKKYILFIHSFTGSDVTSSFFNKGKVIFAKMLESSPELQKAGEEFLKKIRQLKTSFQLESDARLLCTVDSNN